MSTQFKYVSSIEPNFCFMIRDETIAVGTRSSQTQDHLPTLKFGAVSVSVVWPFSLMMVVVFPLSQLLWHLLPTQVTLQMVGVKTTLILPVWFPSAADKTEQTRRRDSGSLVRAIRSRITLRLNLVAQNCRDSSQNSELNYAVINISGKLQNVDPPSKSSCYSSLSTQSKSASKMWMRRKEKIKYVGEVSKQNSGLLQNPSSEDWDKTTSNVCPCVHTSRSSGACSPCLVLFQVHLTILWTSSPHMKTERFVLKARNKSGKSLSTRFSVCSDFSPPSRMPTHRTKGRKKRYLKALHIYLRVIHSSSFCPF